MFRQCPLSLILKSVATAFVRAHDKDGAGNQSWCSTSPFNGRESRIQSAESTAHIELKWGSLLMYCMI